MCIIKEYSHTVCESEGEILTSYMHYKGKFSQPMRMHETPITEILTPYANHKGKFSHPTCITKEISPSLCASSRYPWQKFSQPMHRVQIRCLRVLHDTVWGFSTPYVHHKGKFRHPMCILTSYVQSYTICTCRWHNSQKFAHPILLAHTRRLHLLYNNKTREYTSLLHVGCENCPLVHI